MANFASRISRETVCLNRRLRLINIDTPFRCSAVVSPAEWKVQDHKLIAPAIYFRSAVANVMAGGVPGPRKSRPPYLGGGGGCPPPFGCEGPRKKEKNHKKPTKKG